MDKLVSEKPDGWFEAAQLIVDLGRTIAPTTNVSQSGRFGTKSGNSVSGHAAGVGDVSIDNSERPEHEEQTLEGFIERIGAYKMIHREMSSTIEFWPYRDDFIWSNPDSMHALRITHVVQYDHYGIAQIHALAMYEHRLTWRDIPALIQAYAEAWIAILRRFLSHGDRLKIHVFVIRLHLIGFKVVHSVFPHIVSGTLILRQEFLRRMEKE